MKREELFKKWDELTNLYTEKEVKLDANVQEGLDDNSTLDNEDIIRLIDETNEQVEKLKETANAAISEYTRIGKENMLREEGLKSAKAIVKDRFGLSPDETIITGRVLSSNTSDSYLTGRSKTKDELEDERQGIMADIRNQVVSKKISLSEASNLKNQVNTAYGYVPHHELSTGMKKIIIKLYKQKKYSLIRISFFIYFFDLLE